jgi:hypothetical protein
MAFTSKERRPKSDKEQKDVEHERLEAALEAGLEGTFPASDAVAVTQPARQNATSTESIDSFKKLRVRCDY